MAPQNIGTVIATALASIGTAVATALTNLGWTETVGIVGSLWAFVYVLRTYLQGVQTFEERTQLGVPEEDKVPPADAEAAVMPPGMTNSTGS